MKYLYTKHHNCFSSSHVWMWELDYKEGWAPKNWCFWAVVLEKTLESPVDFKEIQPVHPKGDKSLVFFGRTDAEAETPILWPAGVKNWLIWEDPEAGKDWTRNEKGSTKDEMVRWHHWLNGHEFESTQGVDDGQGGLACCSPWGHRVRHGWATELDWTESREVFVDIFKKIFFFLFFTLSQRPSGLSWESSTKNFEGRRDCWKLYKLLNKLVQVMCSSNQVCLSCFVCVCVCVFLLQSVCQ